MYDELNLQSRSNPYHNSFRVRYKREFADGVVRQGRVVQALERQYFDLGNPKVLIRVIRIRGHDPWCITDYLEYLNILYILFVYPSSGFVHPSKKYLGSTAFIKSRPEMVPRSSGPVVAVD